jgi:hypothetical protein
MGKILEYLDWRGDLDFTRDPLNDIDALILALLSYLPFEGIVPGVDSDKHISLKETSDQFFSLKQNAQEESSNVSPTLSPTFNSGLLELLRVTANCPRFAEIQCSKYDENTDYIVGRQFGVLTFTLPNKKHEKVVAFRGTDNSLIGWKEDFEIACSEEIPAQESAYRYLEDVIGLFSSKVTVCGHSKGGNLAVYASSRVSAADRRKIRKILNFDGPGFDFSILPRKSFSNCEAKVCNYVPEESIVGMLLEQVGKRVVVSSTARGLNQHNALNWRVERTQFMSGTMSETTKLLEHTLNTWLADLPLAKRKSFIDALFDILGAAEGRTIDPKEDIKRGKAILVKYSKLDLKTKRLLLEVFSSLRAQTRSTLSKTIRENLPRIS